MTDTSPSLRVCVADLNGIARGKRLPGKDLDKVLRDGARMPVSVSNLDLWGYDIEDSPLVFESGDGDCALRPTGRGPVPMPWLASPALLIPCSFYNDDGTPFEGDGRNALAAVLERYAAKGWTPVVATEMEFYLLESGTTPPRPAQNPSTGRSFDDEEILSLRELDAMDPFFTDLYAACDAMGIDAQAAIVEGGPGQFEIDIRHQGDAMKAADDAWTFKLAVQGIAEKHGMRGTFLSKPIPGEAGNGMHVHFSVLDGDGRNIFDDGSAQGSDALRGAVAGTLAAMAETTAIFLPNRNAYRRMAPGSHAPTRATWGYENRTAAVRIPGGPPAARRIEHRLSGGDCNPWLAIAAILGAALHGIEAGLEPPAPIGGNAHDTDAAALPTDWADALAAFETGPIAAEIFAPLLRRGYLHTKRQEARRFDAAGDGADELEFRSYPERL